MIAVGLSVVLSGIGNNDNKINGYRTMAGVGVACLPVHYLFIEMEIICLPFQGVKEEVIRMNGASLVKYCSHPLPRMCISRMGLLQ